jgi:hypothetical protein
VTEPVHELDSAAALLARAWARRSSAERTAFANLAATHASPEPADGSLRAVRDRAALSGAVSPTNLTRGLTPEIAARVLDRLAPEFDRVLTAGRWLWTLRSGPRQTALTRLAMAGELNDRVAEADEVPTDQAGELLRRLAAIRSRHTLPREVSVPDGSQAAVVQALTWARPLGRLAGHLAEAQRRVAVRSLSDSYAAVTMHGVVGRAAELAVLRTFAEGHDQPGQSSPFPFPVLPLTGAAGVGKSTLLGALVRPYLDRIEVGDPTAPAVVVIDFDRELFRRASPLALSFEVTRQLGFAAPIAGADFSALRHQAQAGGPESGAGRHLGYVTSEDPVRSPSRFEREVGVLVRMHGLHERPALLVLDTFEAWEGVTAPAEPRRAPRDTAEEIILEWILRLVHDMGLASLRVIVSGRAAPSGRAVRTAVLTGPPLNIGDLRAACARELLTDLGLDVADASALASAAGGNPLALHLAARSYQDSPEATARDSLAPIAATQAGRRDSMLSRLREALQQMGRRGFSAEQPLCEIVTGEFALVASAVGTPSEGTFEVVISATSPADPPEQLDGVTLDLRIESSHFLASIDRAGRARFSAIPAANWDVRVLGFSKGTLRRGFAMPSLERTGALAASSVRNFTRQVHAPDGRTVFTVHTVPGEDAMMEVSVDAAAATEAPFLIPVAYETDAGQGHLLAAVARHRGRLYTAMTLPGFNPYEGWSAGERFGPGSLAEWEPEVITASVWAARVYDSAMQFWERIAELAPPSAADAIRGANGLPGC